MDLENKMERRKRLLTLCLDLNRAIKKWEKEEALYLDADLNINWGYRTYTYYHHTGRFEFNTIQSAKDFLSKMLIEAKYHNSTFKE